MAPNWSMGSSYSDERRHPGADSFRPGDRERPQPPRRDSRDFRDNRYPNTSREARSPHENRNTREYRRDEPPRPPHIDTSARATEGPRKTSNNSPVSASDKLGEELRFNRLDAERIATPHSANSSLPPLITPKAKNPALQEAFENTYKWGEKNNKRLLLRIRKNKIIQESVQRRLEIEKFDAKASVYPPYHGLGDKFNLASCYLDEQLKAAEDDYLDELEQLVARFTTAAKPTDTTQQSPTTAALEAKVDRLSELVADQAKQIQSLLEEANKSRGSINLLEAAYDDIKTKHSSLASDYDILQKKSSSFENTIDALKSQQLQSDTHIREQLKDFQSNTEKNLGTSETRLTELTKMSLETAESLRKAETSLETRITELGARSDIPADIRDKINELDLGTLDEICEAWISGRYNLKTMHEEYRQRRGEVILSSVEDELRSLQREVSTLRAGGISGSGPDKETSLSQQEIEAIVNEKIMAAEKSISSQNRDFCEERDNLYGGLIDGNITRTAELEQKHAGHEDRISLLEQWKATVSGLIDKNQDPALAGRVARLEGNKIGHRVDRIDLNVGVLGHEYQALKAKLNQLDIHLEEVRQEVLIKLASAHDMQELARKIPSIEIAIKTLDTQFQNLTTKQLAERIVQLVFPGTEKRLGKLETMVAQLEGKTNGNETVASSHTEQLKSIIELLRFPSSGEKRTASPGKSDEPNKKRKLEVNGRYPSPLQQQQQQEQQQQQQQNQGNNPTRQPSS